MPTQLLPGYCTNQSPLQLLELLAELGLEP
jgi:hypothetical protein